MAAGGVNLEKVGCWVRTGLGQPFDYFLQCSHPRGRDWLTPSSRVVGDSLSQHDGCFFEQTDCSILGDDAICETAKASQRGASVY